MRRFHLAPLGPRIKLRHFVHPMLAKLADEPFDKDGWLFEIKWDGYRAIAEIDHGNVALYSRNGLSFATAFAPVVKALTKIKRQAILDGEIVVLDDQGRSSFQALQNYLNARDGTLVYYVFDLLELDGKDLRREPLEARKRLLAKIIGKSPTVKLSDHIERDGRIMFQQAAKLGLEGVIAKKASSRYAEGKRTGEWLKIKVHQRQEAIICGFTAPKGSRIALGSLVLGVYDNGKLVYAGNVGTGFSQRMLQMLLDRLTPLIVDRCPFATRPKLPSPARWAEPRLVCEVEFTEWTGDGIMRHPVFVGLREDKPAKNVKRELPARLN